MRDTTEEAWQDAEEKVAAMAARRGARWTGARGPAVGQQRLLDLAARGEVLDTCLYTAPGRYGGGGAGTTWLVGSPDDVTAALELRRAGHPPLRPLRHPVQARDGPGGRRAHRAAPRVGGGASADRASARRRTVFLITSEAATEHLACCAPGERRPRWPTSKTIKSAIVDSAWVF